MDRRRSVDPRDGDNLSIEPYLVPGRGGGLTPLATRSRYLVDQHRTAGLELDKMDRMILAKNFCQLA